MYFIIIFLLVSGCGDSNPFTTFESTQKNPHAVELEVIMDLPKIDGEYVFQYPTGSPSSYAHIRYQTEPMERVFWFSPDSFTTYHQGFPITMAVVNYSTYSDGNSGLGTQLCYIYQNHIGDTLDIIGCGVSMCDTTRFIVK